MSDINQIGFTDITAKAYPGYINVTREGDEVKLTIRNADSTATAVRSFTRSEAISFFASVIGLLA